MREGERDGEEEGVGAVDGAGMPGWGWYGDCGMLASVLGNNF